jgi:drug/metabolite transporter (DMT)-like permease
MTVSYLKTDYSGMSQLFWSALISLLILLPFGSRVPGEILELNLPVLIMFGIVTTAFASLLYLNSAAKIPTQTVSVLALLEPVSGIILGSLFLHEPIFIKTMQGCVLIIMGALIMVWDTRTMPIYGMKGPFVSFQAAMRLRILSIPRIILMWLSGKY